MPRTVLVTGATSGIGWATLLELARRGFRVVGSARTPDKAAALQARAHEAGVEAETIVLDLTDPDAGADEVRSLDLWGLVNNAGYMNLGAIEDVPAQDAREQLEAMVVAPMRLAQLVLPSMRSRGEGRIVNITSVSGVVDGPITGWYQAVKHALDALSDALRIEAMTHGIEVIVVAPGAYETDIWARATDELNARRVGSAYGPAYDRALRILRAIEPHVGDPAALARAIGDALVAGRPRHRYRVGPGSRLLQVVDAVAPADLKDRALRVVLGL